MISFTELFVNPSIVSNKSREVKKQDDKMSGLGMPVITLGQLSLIITLLCQIVIIHHTAATTNDVENECKNFCLLGAKGEQASS